mmetsp:Transcript_18585/g.62300  ORF Transcript_18585/g.62300 Transcript_18585/m.62300 type:complete len:146 (-) Transcript_18585:409-846(-)
MAAASFWFWLLMLAAATGLMLCLVVHLITYSDLESDYINPVDATERLNRFVVPEYAVQAAMTVLFLVTLNLFPLLCNAALLAWHVQQYRHQAHLLDATSIYPRLQECKRHCLAKLGFYSLAFLYYLYRMVYALVATRTAHRLKER